jgi:hypothetical protein
MKKFKISVTVFAFAISNFFSVVEGEEFDGVVVADWWFCAICSVEVDGGEPGRWYRFKPKEVYWGSHVEASDRMFAHRKRFGFEDDNETKRREYLILIGGDVSKGGASYRCVPVSEQGVDLRWLGNNESEKVSPKELYGLLERWSKRMRKKFPVDK